VRPVFLRVQEAADYLRVSYNSVLGAIKNGSLPAYKVGPRRGTYRISLADLIAYAESSRTPNTPSRRSGNQRTGSKFKKLDTDRLLNAWKRQGVVPGSPEE
jgi:excisionase family DNA binding protein